MSGRRGETGGHGNGERRQRWRSGALGEERTREEGEREGVRAVRGSAWRCSGRPSVEGEDRQAGREVAWRGGARARRAHSVPLSGRKTTEEGGPGGLGRLLAGPACCGWAAQGGAPGKPLLSFIFVF